MATTRLNLRRLRRQHPIPPTNAERRAKRRAAEKVAKPA